MSEENKAIVRREFEEIFTQGNLDAADEIYASNLSVTKPPLLKAYTASRPPSNSPLCTVAPSPTSSLTIEDQSAAEREKVVTRWIARGTHQLSLMSASLLRRPR